MHASQHRDDGRLGGATRSIVLNPSPVQGVCAHGGCDCFALSRLVAIGCCELVILAFNASVCSVPCSYHTYPVDPPVVSAILSEYRPQHLATQFPRRSIAGRKAADGASLKNNGEMQVPSGNAVAQTQSVDLSISHNRCLRPTSYGLLIHVERPATCGRQQMICRLRFYCSTHSKRPVPTSRTRRNLQTNCARAYVPTVQCIRRTT